MSIEKQTLKPPNICMLRENTFLPPFPGLTSLPVPLYPPLLSPQVALCPCREAVRRGGCAQGAAASLCSFPLTLFWRGFSMSYSSFSSVCLFLRESSMDLQGSSALPQSTSYSAGLGAPAVSHCIAASHPFSLWMALSALKCD